jgi:tRNA modification GTPase
MSAADTIHALSSGEPPAGVAVIRVSGPAAEAAVAALAPGPLPPPRRAVLRALRAPDGEVLDEALVLRFPEGASFTGEAMAEFHCHGGRAVVRAVLAALEASVPCRMAEPGEFTLRAWRNGRLDLAGVEALSDLVSAETEAQRRQAARLVSGGLRARAESWRDRLVRAMALVEVTIDWADEEVPEDVSPEVAEILGGLLREIDRELALADGAERLRHGYEVAILGAPNAGKSSLLNALAGREAAITSPVPGTTRDVVELRYDLEGLPVIFLDMAGLRATDDPVERIGVERARDRAAGAELRVALSAPDAPLTEEVSSLLRPGDLRVRAKADLGVAPGTGEAVSAVTGERLGALLDRIATCLRACTPQGGLVAHRRQRRALEGGREAIELARKGLDRTGAEEVSEELRRAVRALERLIGAVGVEDVLDEVFSRFCLGK